MEKEGDENLKETIPNTGYDRSITAEKSGRFQQFLVAYQMMQDVHGKFNPGLPHQNQHSTGRRLCSPTKWV